MMTDVSRYLINHLVTFSQQEGEVKSVDEAQSCLSRLARAEKLWSQQIVLEISPEVLRLRDTQSQDELEKYPVSSIHRCDAILTEKRFPSLLLLVCQSAPQTKPDVLFFNCETVRAEQIRDDITRAVSGYSSRSKKRPEALRFPPIDPVLPQNTKAAMMDPYGIPSPPIPHAPNAPPANPPPYPGIRANGVNSGQQPDSSFLRAEKEVGILNHCFDDIEVFMAKLQQTAEAASVLSQRKKKKKSRKQTPEEDLLTAKARPPPEEEFMDIFQKLKYCFSLLARLKSSISNPSSEELLHHVFKPLDMLVRTTGGPALGASVTSPALTNSAVTLLQDNLSEEERLLWTALGPHWTLPRSQLKGPVAPYTPVFLDGWKPEASRADRQVYEDPVESQHKHEALREKQELQPTQPVGPPVTPKSNEMDSSVLPPEGERMYRCSYDFVARNNSELSVQQGDTLEVVESSKRWWKCRNRFNEVGFVPFNILEPVAHIDSPVTMREPKPPVSPALTKTHIPPSPPAFNPSSLTPSPSAHHRPRPLSYNQYSQHIPAGDDADKAMMVNDELLQRLTNGKANLNKPLVIPRSSDTLVPLDYNSPPEEVEQWLRGKGFSETTVTLLGKLTGALLFSLNKEDLRQVLPDEGARVYSQLTVQKALLEDARKATELEAVMEKQKMKMDLKLESSTL
ncbi:epidermal growth factor receptor kinase substrate 8-like protein 1 isoform X1 [Salmo salar]|uniref:Epidermal growth factor receptor kinase substrate 8-like protein 1 n=2 Tax=Salmo salar TaxID=8030 RepID=A0A1S3NG64_SALSA|nr:epidermal growth factor receptor kinase substrate 8-like protein 1 isoform X1 [Salmo salar]XP_045558491.1 epidermal growth factor receptor kinase substrate 8-like protein 1 isoform X1 [Salmo salar]|eukprot:XP_014014444.1 PREDICTED: epidermal growth factor receptor kinase substrate 8-like protein 1 [Salmo salar]